MSQIISPAAFFALVVLGALGVALALPRRQGTPQVLGAIVAGGVGGLLMLALGLKAGLENIPNLYFYVFAAIGLGSALRVITHPRPVYAALYFIMTVIASAGLFLLLSAEFMAFALIIVYAGAILITYLFVIMLATQAPEEGQEDVLAEYDIAAREPIAATVVGFALLAVLTTMMFRGVGQLPAPQSIKPDALLVDMPRKVERVLASHNLIAEGHTVKSAVVLRDGTLEVTTREKDVAEGEGIDQVVSVPRSQWPEELAVTNTELLGFNFLRDHPGTIEIAGVILLMAMLGAVVLSRKQVQIDEDAKMARVTQLAKSNPAHDPVAEAPVELVQQPTHAGPAGGAA